MHASLYYYYTCKCAVTYVASKENSLDHACVIVWAAACCDVMEAAFKEGIPLIQLPT